MTQESIRAGGASVEVGIDQPKLNASLEASGRRIAAWYQEIQATMARAKAAVKAGDVAVAESAKAQAVALKALVARERETMAAAARGFAAATGPVPGGLGAEEGLGLRGFGRTLGAGMRLGGYIMAARVATGVLDALGELVHGTADAFYEGLRKVPILGIGAELGLAIRNLFTGEIQDIRRLQEQGVMIAGERKVRDAVRDLTDETSLLAVEGIDRQRLAIMQWQAKEIRKIEEAVVGLPTGTGAMLWRAINEAAAAKLAELERSATRYISERFVGGAGAEFAGGWAISLPTETGARAAELFAAAEASIREAGRIGFIAPPPPPVTAGPALMEAYRPYVDILSSIDARLGQIVQNTLAQ